MGQGSRRDEEMEREAPERSSLKAEKREVRQVGRRHRAVAAEERDSSKSFLKLKWGIVGMALKNDAKDEGELKTDSYSLHFLPPAFGVAQNPLLISAVHSSYVVIVDAHFIYLLLAGIVVQPPCLVVCLFNTFPGASSLLITTKRCFLKFVV